MLFDIHFFVIVLYVWLKNHHGYGSYFKINYFCIYESALVGAKPLPKPMLIIYDTVVCQHESMS